jgi:transposase
MPSKLPRIVKLQALELDAQGYDQQDIAETLAISVGTITKAKRKMKAIGDVEGGQRKRGPKPKMDPGMRDVHFLIRFILINFRLSFH